MSPSTAAVTRKVQKHCRIYSSSEWLQPDRHKSLTENRQKARQVILPAQPACTPWPRVLPRASAGCTTNLAGNSQKQTLAQNTASSHFKPGMLSFYSLLPKQFCLSYKEISHSSCNRKHVTMIQIHTEWRLWPPKGAKAAEGPVPFLSGGMLSRPISSRSFNNSFQVLL